MGQHNDWREARGRVAPPANVGPTFEPYLQARPEKAGEYGVPAFERRSRGSAA
jgi:hypothetical protein